MHLKYTETVLGYRIHFITVDPNNSQVLFENETITVTSIPMDHRIPCTGFLFKEKPKSYRLNKMHDLSKLSIQEINTLKRGKDVLMGSNGIKYRADDYTMPPRKSRSYAYCSDTRYFEAIIPHIESVDLLYHESTFLSDQEQRAHETYHSTALQAATIASRAQVGKLILGHFSIRYKDLEPLLTEAKKVFSNTFLAVEGQRVPIEPENHDQEA